MVSTTEERLFKRPAKGPGPVQRMRGGDKSELVYDQMLWINLSSLAISAVGECAQMPYSRLSYRLRHMILRPGLMDLSFSWRSRSTSNRTAESHRRSRWTAASTAHHPALPLRLCRPHLPAQYHRNLWRTHMQHTDDNSAIYLDCPERHSVW